MDSLQDKKKKKKGTVSSQGKRFQKPSGRWKANGTVVDDRKLKELQPGMCMERAALKSGNNIPTEHYRNPRLGSQR